jgi:hypothetical protein
MRELDALMVAFRDLATPAGTVNAAASSKTGIVHFGHEDSSSGAIARRRRRNR